MGFIESLSEPGKQIASFVARSNGYETKPDAEVTSRLANSLISQLWGALESGADWRFGAGAGFSKKIESLNLDDDQIREGIEQIRSNLKDSIVDFPRLKGYSWLADK